MSTSKPKDLESNAFNNHIPYFSRVFKQGVVNEAIRNHQYPGSGTESDPYLVSWINDDPVNPQNYKAVLKWSITMLVGVATLAVAFVSSAYSGGVQSIIAEFGASSEVVTLGVSLFVLGFALGPLIWAPMSELFGRQYLFFGTYAMLTFFNAGAAGSQNIWTLIILRFFAGAFGSSPLTNAGGVIADCFPASQRGMAMSIFAAAPFLGPVLGPIVGGFVGETIGWRWIEGIMAIFTGVLWLVCGLLVPETYAPVLLRARAKTLSRETGKVYKSKIDQDKGEVTVGEAFKTNLSRPWILLFREPIVLLLSLYMAIIYGTLYMLFAAFPIVYQQQRGWSPGIGGLSFIGVAIGMLIAVTYSIFYDNKRYLKVANQNGGMAPPEARLPPCIIGGIAIPIGLFWFAWTNSPSLPWAASVAAGIPFGFGMVLVFLGIMNYLIDAYVIYAASVLAASAVIRSLFGAAFPLFTSYMYQNLGIHWASSVPAFLALACVPFPFLFYRYGAQIRSRCKFAAQAADFLKQFQGGNEKPSAERQDSTGEEKDGGMSSDDDKEPIEEKDEHDEPLGLTQVKTAKESVGQRQQYDHNPFDLDRVNTRDSFNRTTSRRSSRASRT